MKLRPREPGDQNATMLHALVACEIAIRQAQLQSLLSSKIRVNEAGRPKKISAEERQELRERADKLKASGQNLRDIIVQFSEEYELRPSYIRRILEDRRNEKR